MSINKSDNEFSKKSLRSWKCFKEHLDAFEDQRWIYRGQSQDWCLTTSFERSCNNWCIPGTERSAVERQLIREFRRRYQGIDRDEVRTNIRYCLALMQHHGAPTRLLDFSYSPFVAAHNAVKDGKKECHVVWCFRVDWLEEAAAAIVGWHQVNARSFDRSDTTFLALYKRNRPVVLHENPLHLNERLTIQQGLFLCPANVEISFLDNLRKMTGYELPYNILKFQLVLDSEERAKFSQQLKLMNISSAALFPGLDGFSRSLGELIFHHNEIAKTMIE